MLLRQEPERSGCLGYNEKTLLTRLWSILGVKIPLRQSGDLWFWYLRRHYRNHLRVVIRNNPLKLLSKLLFNLLCNAAEKVLRGLKSKPLHIIWEVILIKTGGTLHLIVLPTWLIGSLKFVMRPARSDVFSSSDKALWTNKAEKMFRVGRCGGGAEWRATDTQHSGLKRKNQRHKTSINVSNQVITQGAFPPEAPSRDFKH